MKKRRNMADEPLPIQPETPPTTPVEPPKVLLCLSDPRFTFLMRSLTREFQKKFLKLFERTPDKDKRNLTEEAAGFLAAFAHMQFMSIDEARQGQGADPHRVFQEMLKVLRDVFVKNNKDTSPGEHEHETSKQGPPAAAQTEVPGAPPADAPG